jgi:chromosome segregation protein
MEVADALYGVTMRDDGITTVISQRMRGQEVAAAGGPPAYGEERSDRGESMVSSA